MNDVMSETKERLAEQLEQVSGAISLVWDAAKTFPDTFKLLKQADDAITDAIDGLDSDYS